MIINVMWEKLAYFNIILEFLLKELEKSLKMPIRRQSWAEFMSYNCRTLRASVIHCSIIRFFDARVMECVGFVSVVSVCSEM